MSKWQTDFENEQWSNAIAAFERWKKLYNSYRSEYALNRMRKIKSEWPNHSKSFDIPESATTEPEDAQQ